METLKEKLLLWKKRDTNLEVFGASEHRYQLNSPLPLKDFEVIEKKYDCTFPQEYKTFITEIGNGGAGPGLGIFPIGKWDGYFDQETKQMRDSWDDVSFIGELSKPFLFTEALDAERDFWNNLAKKLNINLEELSEEEDSALCRKYWDEMVEYLHFIYGQPNLMQGAIPICHLGCAKRNWLILNGPLSGYVWLNLTCNDAGIFPCLNKANEPMTFFEWYENWFVESFEELNSVEE